jgi:hypothetical protein
MSAVHSLSSLTMPEQDMLAWYRLGPDPAQHPLRPTASIPVYDLPEATAAEPIQSRPPVEWTGRLREPLPEDTPAELIDMPIAA